MKKLLLDTHVWIWLSMEDKKSLSSKAAAALRQASLKCISAISCWELVVNDGDSILEAASLVSRYHFSFWDCLIIQAALKSGCNILLSEDLSDSQVIESLQIRNPF